jgi:uncharacterized SAM-binding protein YcdF (DUF218 family)
MFLAAKILALLTQPLAWVAALLLGGLLVLRRRPALGRRLTGSALAVLLAAGWQPLPDLLIRRLEAQYAEIPPQADLRGYVGMVVLGGALESGHVALAHTQPLLTDAAERMTAPLASRLRNPHLRVVFTGGEGSLLGSGPTEAERARNFFDSLGPSEPPIEYEAASRNTYENAVLTAQLPGVNIAQPWLLVTSAWHMPRAMATFAKAGWNVTAYPVDFRTGTDTPWTEYSLEGGIVRWQLVLHEGLGLLAYRLSGRL